MMLALIFSILLFYPNAASASGEKCHVISKQDVDGKKLRELLYGHETAPDPTKALNKLKQIKHPLARAYEAYFLLDKNPKAAEKVFKSLETIGRLRGSNLGIQTVSDFNTVSYEKLVQFLKVTSTAKFNGERLYEGIDFSSSFEKKMGWIEAPWPAWLFMRHVSLMEENGRFTQLCEETPNFRTFKRIVYNEELSRFLDQIREKPWGASDSDAAVTRVFYFQKAFYSPDVPKGRPEVLYAQLRKWAKVNKKSEESYQKGVDALRTRCKKVEEFCSRFERFQKIKTHWEAWFLEMILKEINPLKTNVDEIEIFKVGKTGNTWYTQQKKNTKHTSDKSALK